jgi:hypothetical protein
VDRLALPQRGSRYLVSTITSPASFAVEAFNQIGVSKAARSAASRDAQKSRGVEPRLLQVLRAFSSSPTDSLQVSVRRHFMDASGA